METNIRNQHYVWRHYLKPWLSDGKLWCCRRGKTFLVNPEKIAKDDYFYKAEPLSPNETLLVREGIQRMHSSSHDLLEGIFSMYNWAANGDEHRQNNTLESYHSFAEKTAIDILNHLYADDLSFWQEAVRRELFCYYLGIQYLRTKKSREIFVKAHDRLKNHPGNPSDINPSKIACVLSLFYADAIGNWLASKAIPSIIHNESEIGFLTCDQPISNLRADYRVEFSNINEFQLYYPISPTTALVLQDHQHLDSAFDADSLNTFIFNVTREYTFGRVEADLKKYLC